MNMKILAIPIALVIAIGAVAGLSLSGHLSRTTTTTTPQSVYLGHLIGPTNSGINSTAVWMTVQNIGNGTATITQAYLLDGSTIVTNQTLSVGISPGHSTIITITGSWNPQYAYTYGVVCGSCDDHNRLSVTI